MKTNNYAGIDPHIVAVIEREVKKIVGRYGITAADVQDIEQDLHSKVDSLLPELEHVAFEAAVCQIVKHALIDRIRWQERACRDWRRIAFSLDDLAADDDDFGEGHADIMDLAKSFDTGFGRPACLWSERLEMAMDLEECLRRLPRELRDLAETLDSCNGNLSGAARVLRISRKKARIRLARLQQAMACLLDG